jgi:hypothetical protein
MAPRVGPFASSGMSTILPATMTSAMEILSQPFQKYWMLAALKRIGATEQPNDDTPSESNGVSIQRSPADQVGKLMMSVLCSRVRETGLLTDDCMSEGLKQ